MGWGSFYKSKKPRKFRYIYRYYDPKKEELDRKIRLSRHRLDPDANPIDETDVKDNLKGYFRRNSDKLESYEDSEDFSDRIEKKTHRLIFILVLLVAFFVWIFQSIGIVTLRDFFRLFVFW